MAAGLTVAPERLNDLRDFLAERLAGAADAAPAGRSFGIDGVLAPAGATPDLARLLSDLGPFGSGNPEPRFAVAGARIVRADPAGAEHVRCIVAGADGGRLKAIAFRAFETELGRALMRSSGAALHLAGALRLNAWQGREEAQLVIEDAADVR
jgi:single-stranded-DNA-specific exonuclease